MNSLGIPSIPRFLVGVAFSVAAVGVGSAQAQTSVTISMATPPAEPRLQGPFLFGAFPSSPFLFSIPATGDAPLSFSATGLPSGLTLDPSTGIVSGTTPAAGSYPIEVTITNAAGSASASYSIESDTTLALTPPMGWNSYDSYGASVTEQDMIDQADAVRQTLQPFGWNYVVIDYRWYEPGQPIDANGRYLPATSKYPSATGSTGFSSLADQIHARGLGFGIHIMRGVPRKSYDADLPIAGSSYTTGDAGNTSDPCPWDDHMWGVRGDTAAGQAWYDALFAQYAEWGVDFVKIDDMLNNSTHTFHQAEAEAIRSAVEKTGRSIVLSFSPGPDDPSWLPNSASSLNGTANMWRVVNDFWDYNALTDLPGVFREAEAWQAVSSLTPGHWADLDMLPLGYLGPRNEWHASGQTQFSNNEQVTIMSLWSILPSPLMFGGNPEELSSDDWTRALLTNEEVLAINQDSLGARGVRMAANGNTETWVRELSGGRRALAFFNRGTSDTTMSATLEEIGISDAPVVRDVWQRAEVTLTDTTVSADVPGGAARLFSLSPPSTGAGGTGGSTTTDGVAGSTSDAATTSAGTSSGGAATTDASSSTSAGAMGGATASSGADSSSGTGVGGATSTSSAASGVTGSPTTGVGGGMVDTGALGATSTSGSATTPSDSGGCGCRLPEHRSTPTPLVVFAVLGFGMIGIRRAAARPR